jgi:hypothetical protein
VTVFGVNARLAQHIEEGQKEPRFRSCRDGRMRRKDPLRECGAGARHGKQEYRSDPRGGVTHDRGAAHLSGLVAT